MKKYFFLFIIAIGFNYNLIAQATNDAGLWCTFNIDKKISSDFKVFLTEEYRLRDNLTMSNLFYTDIGVSYKPFDFFKVSLAYRNIQKFQIDNSISIRHRAMIDILFKKKIGDFNLSYRQRVQAEVRDVNSSEIGAIPEWYSRNKFQIKYDIDKPITPYIAAEFRYQISNPRALESNNIWSRNRYFVGLDYKKNNQSVFGLYYMIQQEYDVSAPNNLYIIGLEYSYSIK
jgi:hypothetical protein